MVKDKIKNIDKKTHKFIIGAVIGSAIVGVGIFSRTKRGKSFFGRIKSKISDLKNFFSLGISELKSFIKRSKK